MKIVVTAGPTREFIDPVRFLSNRSSGRMGYAVAGAAVARGHEVALVSGPVAIAPPPGARVRRVISALDMLAAVEDELTNADVLVMAAAVADWRPAFVAPSKLKKTRASDAGDAAWVRAADGASATLRLVPNPDILATLRPRKGHRLFVGFAAETDHVLDEARRKLLAKGLDLVVANDVSRPDAGFEVETNAVTILSPDAPPEAWPLLPKATVAERLVERIERSLADARRATDGFSR